MWLAAYGIFSRRTPGLRALLPRLPLPAATIRGRLACRQAGWVRGYCAIWRLQTRISAAGGFVAKPCSRTKTTSSTRACARRAAKSGWTRRYAVYFARRSPEGACQPVLALWLLEGADVDVIRSLRLRPWALHHCLYLGWCCYWCLVSTGSPLYSSFWALPFVYLAVLIAAGIQLAAYKKDPALSVGFPLAAASMHTFWGAGLLVGLVSKNAR